MNTAALTLNETNLLQKYGRSAAELLKKLLYWTNKSESKKISKKPIGIFINGKRYIYNTNKEWAKQTGYSDRQIQRAVSKLSKDEIVFLGKHSRYGKPPINTLAINDKKLIELGFATHTLSKSTPETTNDITSTLNHMSPINIGHHDLKKPRNNTVQDMISIWNIKFPNHQTVLTKENGSYLYTAYKNNFNYDMKEWEDYCSFLAGQNSQGISLDLALKFGTINTYKNKHRQFPAHNYQDSTPYNSKVSNQISNDVLAFAISDQLPKSDMDTSKSQEMLDVWNRIFEKKGTVTMTSKLSIQLGQSLKENFNSNLEEWKAYCLSVESSAYLMGEKFELHISTWALKKENIDKVKNGKLGVTKKFNPVIRHIDDAETHIAEMALRKEDPLLNQMRKFFVNIYGAAAYKSWIMHTKFEIENGELSISSDAPFTRDTIKREYYKIFDYVKTNATNKIEDETSQKADQSITKNKRYTKKTKIIKRCYMPHDIKKKFVFHKNCSITKENIILQYGFILKKNDLSLGDNLNAVATESEKILTHRQNPNQADINQTLSLSDERRGENTNTIMDINRQLNNPQGLLDVTLGDISSTPSTKETKIISEELTCDKLVQNETEIENCEYSKMGDIPPPIKANITPYRKNLPRHKIDSNVVEGGGHLRHVVVSYIRTKILKQHNNKLIRTTSPCNNLSKSNQQVRNYYLKFCYLKKEVQSENSEIKYTKKTFVLNKKYIGVQRKFFYHSMKISSEKENQPLKTNFVGKWRAEKSLDTKKLTIVKEGSCNSPFDGSVAKKLLG